MTNAYEVICDDTTTITRDEWLLLRRQGLGSSDAAPAMSLSPWTSAYSLYAEKSGLLAEREDTERFWWGRALEPVILDRADELGWFAADRVDHLMLRSIERPWMLANPDALTPAEVVEVKTSDGWMKSRWDSGVPDHYLLQAMWLMEVTGRRKAVLPVLFGGSELQRYVVEYDPAIAGPMVAAGEAMWNRVLNQDPPDPDGSEASMLALREVYQDSTAGGCVDLPAHWEPVFEDRRLWASRAADAKAEIDAIKARTMVAMRDNELATCCDLPVATWAAGKDGKRRFLWKDPSK